MSTTYKIKPMVMVFALFVGVVVLVAEYQVAAQDHSPRQVFSESPPSQTELERPKLVRLSGIDFKAFTELCIAIKDDGRLPLFQTILDSQIELEPADCRVCKPLFRRLASICREVSQPRLVTKSKDKKRPKKPKGKDQEEVVEDTEVATPSPTVSPVIKQLEPHANVIQLTSTFFTKLASLKAAEDFLPFVERFARLLRSDYGRTPAEIQYFGIITEFSFSPFELIARRVKRERELAAEDE